MSVAIIGGIMPGPSSGTSPATSWKRRRKRQTNGVRPGTRKIATYSRSKVRLMAQHPGRAVSEHVKHKACNGTGIIHGEICVGCSGRGAADSAYQAMAEEIERLRKLNAEMLEMLRRVQDELFYDEQVAMRVVVAALIERVEKR